MSTETKSTAESLLEDGNHAVQINEERLDRECVRLPSLYLKYSAMAAALRKDLDDTKAGMELIEADLKQKIRAAPDHYKLEKVTEGAINEIVTSHHKYIAAQKKFGEAKYQLELCQSVVAAIDHKKRALTLLVELHGMNYFADIKPSQEGRDAVEDMTRRAVRRSVPKKDSKTEDNDNE